VATVTRGLCPAVDAARLTDDDDDEPFSIYPGALHTILAFILPGMA